MINRFCSRPFLTLFVLLALLFAALAQPASAQSTAITVTKTAEYNIGLHCPVSATLDPTQTQIWLLMDNCGTEPYGLRGFKVADGQALVDDTNMFTDGMSSLKASFMDAEAVPLAFTPDGMLDLIYNDSTSKDTHNLHLRADSGNVATSSLTLLTKDKLASLILAFAGTPASTVYNHAHTLAVAIDTASFHILDLQTGIQRFQIDAQPKTLGSFPSFSVDGKSLYIATLNHPDDINDNSTVLKIYSLSDGKLLQSYPVPSSLLWVSPDGRYAAAQLNDTDFEVVELASGTLSPIIKIPEAPQKVTICLNTGLPIGGDVPYYTQGDLPLMDLTWLPDSSGFLTVNSYEGVGGESNNMVCVFDYSRLRKYTVQSDG
ncbi:MAG: hypothetical protein H0X30_01545 [Anaerolineae bacterium]|nr:hypothetical protein [Anaerolineae bacterium]